MSEQQIRRKAQQLQQKARLETLFWVVIGGFFFVMFARFFARVEEMLPRIGWGLLSLWGLYSAYHAYHWIWPTPLPPEAPADASLTFYRRELERRLDHNRDGWKRSGLPFFFLGIAIALVPGFFESPKLLLNAVPFLVLLCLWVPMFFFMRRKKQHDLQEEIDELKTLER